MLFGDTLADKLAPPGALVDLDPGLALTSAPAAPGRPAHLRLGAARDARAATPSDARLEDPRARGRLLHAFANHELLALELFALALLRFPDAPPGFRLGLGRVMVEEHAHLAAYLERMRALGVSFGDEPTSAFFWTTLSPVRTPAELVAGLSLTFEQANLDFAAHYASVLRRLGDEDTAALLDRVLQDEVGHVRHGLAWFERWRDPATSCWDAWVAALPPPLVPRRARGRGALQREARRAAGLSDDFVRRLALAGESTGRTPVVHAFLPAFEHELAGEPASPAARDVARDQAALPIFLARTGDVVVVPAAPDLAWLESLARAGVAPPELLVGDLPAAVRALAGRPLSGLAPWGWSPGARAALAPLFAQVRPGPFAWLPDEAHARALPTLASKAWAAERLRALLLEHPGWAHVVGEAEPGVVCRDEASARAAVATITDAGRRAVIKAPWGASGRGALRVDGAPDDAQTTWLRRTLERQGAVVVEPWLDRVADLSVQLDLRDDGGPKLLGVTRFFCDRRGQYAGHVVGPRDAGLPPRGPSPPGRAPGRPPVGPRRARGDRARRRPRPGPRRPPRPGGRRRAALPRRAGGAAPAPAGGGEPAHHHGPRGARPRAARRARPRGRVAARPRAAGEEGRPRVARRAGPGRGRAPAATGRGRSAPDRRGRARDQRPEHRARRPGAPRGRGDLRGVRRGAGAGRARGPAPAVIPPA